MPATSARPPTTQKGTSAPRRRRQRIGEPAQRSTAAASDEPPPSPPPTGMRFTSRTPAVRPATRQRPADQVVGTGSQIEAAGITVPFDLEPVAVGIHHQRVGQVERDHLGRQLVVAVGAAAEDAERHA